MKSLINNSYIGALIGVIVPIITIYIAYWLKSTGEVSISQFVDGVQYLEIYVKMITVSVYFSNVVCFFLFIKLDWLKAARGVLLATIIYTFTILIMVGA
ncbi:hypothetical protein L3073_16475 [Ancylomarina sp. DW003]|nr:hypothetical protein [Ancylomarina sp. DW003]MDE5423811.1 hypothetical protein [Ancylomarina sp. DW003]